MCFTCMVMYGSKIFSIQAENLNVVSMGFQWSFLDKPSISKRFMSVEHGMNFDGPIILLSSWWMIGHGHGFSWLLGPDMSGKEDAISYTYHIRNSKQLYLFLNI